MAANDVHVFSDEAGPVCPSCGVMVDEIPYVQTHFGALITDMPFDAVCVDGHEHTYQYDEKWD